MAETYKKFTNAEFEFENATYKVEIDFLCNDNGDFVDCYRVTFPDGQVIYMREDEHFLWVEKDKGASPLSKKIGEVIELHTKQAGKNSLH